MWEFDILSFIFGFAMGFILALSGALIGMFYAIRSKRKREDNNS